MLLSEDAKRCVIYFIYDKDGVIDDYVLEQLRDLKKNAKRLHCVVNGNLSRAGKLALEKIADDVFVRENRGYDIGAYKAALEYIGWDVVESFDEIVLMNNTCFGPVYPFSECFSWARKKNVDIWALTWGQKANWLGTNDYLHYNSRATHLQSYFLAMRKSLFKKGLLKKFFREIPANCNYVQSGSYFEYAFPGWFEERGFKAAAYCSPLDEKNYPLLHNPERLLREFRMPLFKKRSFFHHYTDVLNNTAGEGALRLVEFLEQKTRYDMSVVWKALLRTQSLSDLTRCCQLRRILPKRIDISKSAGKKNSPLKTGLVFHCYYPELFSESVSYMTNFPNEVKILITTDTQKKAALLEALAKKARLSAKIALVKNRGRDVSALLVAAKDFVKKFDLVCFAHDKKSAHVRPESVGKSWSFKLNENLFGSKEFVLNVISMFQNEPHLGMAFPSYPNHSNYLKDCATGWTSNFENTKALLEKFGVNVKINERSLCVAPLGTCFWFRTCALEMLFCGPTGKGWKYADFPPEPSCQTDGLLIHAIERSYAYFAQEKGYYPVFLYNDEYARIDLTNLEFLQGSAGPMRAWCDALVMNAIGYRNLQAEYGKPLEEITDAEIMQGPPRTPPPPAGIKDSAKNLGQAVRRRFPKIWRLLWPVRKGGKLFYRLYKKVVKRGR